MKIQLLLTNLVLVAALFFNLAFVCGNDNRSGESTSTENQDEETINQTENQDVQGPRLGKYDILILWKSQKSANSTRTLRVAFRQKI